MNKKLYFFLAFSLLFINNLFSTDLIIFKDGSIQLGEIISYENDEFVQFVNENGEIVNLLDKNILTFQKNIDLKNIITQSLSPSYNLIQFYPRKKSEIYEISPMYSYKGQRFKMETEWGKQTEILEFFEIFEKNTSIDDETQQLINQLKNNLKKENKIVKTSAILQITGMALLLSPYFFMDDSTTPVTFKDWTAIPAGIGLCLDFVGLGIILSRLNVNEDKLIEDIAISYNKNIIEKQ